MNKQKKNKERISLSFFVIFFLMCIMSGIIGVSLPETLNFVNNLEKGAFYGYFASYPITIIIFWVVLKPFKSSTTRPNYYTIFYKKLVGCVKK